MKSKINEKHLSKSKEKLQDINLKAGKFTPKMLKLDKKINPRKPIVLDIFIKDVENKAKESKTVRRASAN